MTCEVDGRRLEKKNCDNCLQIWLEEKRILKIWQVEIDFFLDTQNVYNNEIFEMSNTWIAGKKLFNWSTLSASKPYLWVGHQKGNGQY